MTDHALVGPVARAMADSIPEEQWDWSEESVNGEIIAPLFGSINMHQLATAALRAIEDAGYTITPTAAPTRAD